MIYRSSPEEIKKYYENQSLNQSAIKVIIRDGMQAFLAEKERLLATEELPYYEEKEHFLIGQAVDCFITQGEEVYNNTYHFSRLAKKPKDTGLSIIHKVFDQVKANTSQILEFTFYKEEIYNACNDHSYYMNRRKADWAEDKRIETILKMNAEAYWQELIEAGNKIILSDDQNMKINTITTNLLHNTNTAEYFKDKSDTDIYYQLPIYFTMSGIPCKGLIDQVRINHRFKRIFLFDIKTTREFITRFNREIRKRRYDIQGAFYSCGMIPNKEELGKLIGKDLSNYTIANFAFIVESTTYPGIPLIFVLNNDLLHIGRFGDSEQNILGFEYGGHLYKDWAEKDFDLSKLVGNGVIMVDGLYEYIDKLF